MSTRLFILAFTILFPCQSSYSFPAGLCLCLNGESSWSIMFWNLSLLEDTHCSEMMIPNSSFKVLPRLIRNEQKYATWQKYLLLCVIISRTVIRVCLSGFDLFLIGTFYLWVVFSCELESWEASIAISILKMEKKNVELGPKPQAPN